MKSLDPRVSRLQVPEKWENPLEQEKLDQLETFEVFVQSKENRPYQHEGVVHASDEDMAFIFAKEQFSRRSTCTGIKIARTRNVFVSGLTEAETSVYENLEPADKKDGTEDTYIIFNLLKRGKQHKLAGEVKGTTPEDALYQAKLTLDPGKPVYNVWIVKAEDILTISDENKVIWDTLPEKSFRDAIAYRGADKIKKFREEQGLE